MMINYTNKILPNKPNLCISLVNSVDSDQLASAQDLHNELIIKITGLAENQTFIYWKRHICT